MEGATALADALRVTGVLTDINLASNSLKDEGVVAICAAVQCSKETKLASLNLAENNAGLPGAKSVAAMLAVTGVLTSVRAEGSAHPRADFGSTCLIPPMSPACS